MSDRDRPSARLLALRVCGIAGDFGDSDAGIGLADFIGGLFQRLGPRAVRVTWTPSLASCMAQAR
jgi:hypothetical protein